MGITHPAEERPRWRQTPHRVCGSAVDFGDMGSSLHVWSALPQSHTEVRSPRGVTWRVKDKVSRREDARPRVQLGQQTWSHPPFSVLLPPWPGTSRGTHTSGFLVGSACLGQAKPLSARGRRGGGRQKHGSPIQGQLILLQKHTSEKQELQSPPLLPPSNTL